MTPTSRQPSGCGHPPRRHSGRRAGARGREVRGVDQAVELTGRWREHRDEVPGLRELRIERLQPHDVELLDDRGHEAEEAAFDAEVDARHDLHATARFDLDRLLDDVDEDAHLACVTDLCIRQHKSHVANDTVRFVFVQSGASGPRVSTEEAGIMPSRIDSELLLVGSLPASSTDEALRAGGELFGDLVFALPDGETGPRALWAAYEFISLLNPHPDIEITRPGGAPPRHVEEIPVLGVKPDVDELRFDRWPRIDDAIESYAVFRALRDEGVIPSHVRFQLSLPFRTSTAASFKHDFARDFPIVGAAYEELFAREITRLTDAIPPEDLAIQWDVCWEVLDLEGVIDWMDDDAWERYAGPGDPHHAAHPGGGPRRLPPLLRDVPDVAHVRGARHGAHRAHGELRGRELGAHRRLAAPGGPEGPAQPGRPVLRAAHRSGDAGHARVPRDRAADRRRRRPAAQARDRLQVPRRLRGRDVLRVRSPARAGRPGDDARAQPRGRGGRRRARS